MQPKLGIVVIYLYIYFLFCETNLECKIIVI